MGISVQSEIRGDCLFIFLPLYNLFNPSVLRTPPLYFAVQNTGEEGESNLPLIAVQYSAYGARQGEDCDTNDFLSQSKKVLVTLIHFICSFISVARRTNPEAPPQLSGLTVYRYGRCWGCGTRICSDCPLPFISVSLASSPPDEGGDFFPSF